jgi:DNA-binding XRE family transcriptional regulator
MHVLHRLVGKSELADYRVHGPLPACPVIRLNHNPNGETMMVNITEREPIPALPPPPERKRLREAFGVTQTELAGELNVSRQMIVAYERGSEPTGQTRIKYAAILKSWQDRLKNRN